MPNEITLTTTKDPFTNESTGTPLVVIQLTPHYRKVLWEFLKDEDRREHLNLYGALALDEVAWATPGIGGAVLTVDMATCIMEAADDEVVATYSPSERNLFAWLFTSIHDLNL